MSERFCPLDIGLPLREGLIPTICWETCSDLFTDANGGSEYDLYTNSGHSEDDAERCLDSTSEHSHAELEATGAFRRVYTTVDQCGEGYEIGEQSYVFTCPNPTEYIN